MDRIRAAEVAKRRLSIAARRLGTKDPSESIGGLIDRSFDLPLGDPRYGSNALLPGSMPLEHSFSEVAAEALRIDLEPLGPTATPGARRNEAGREMRRLVNQCYGAKALRWFDECSEPFRGMHTSGDARFGAWFGAAYDQNGLRESKVYYEITGGRLDDLPPNLRHAASVAMSCLPGLVPIFTSISASRRRGSQRVYLLHQKELRLLDLEPLMKKLGVGHQLPGLLSAVGLILGGRFTLPPGSVIIGLKDTKRGIEMKLEVLLPAVPDPPKEMHGLVQMLLAQRPDSQRAFRQWIQAMTPDEFNSPGHMSVIGVRVNPEMGSRLTIYFKPVGYDQPPQQGRPGQILDPYAMHSGHAA